MCASEDVTNTAKGNPTYSVGEPGGCCAEGKKPVAKGQVLMDSTFTKYLEELKSGRQSAWVLPGAVGRGEWEMSVQGNGAAVCGARKVLETDNGDDHTT